MPEGTTNSIVSLGDVSKPADTLIKKVSKAIGGAFAPYQIKRVAKAEAEAAIITAEGEIQVAEIHRRAMHRFFEEEAKRQQNIEDITSKAFPRLESNADAEAVDDDWITNFFDKSRIVSDSEMQELWSRVLAGEANHPGTYSKRTVNLLGDLDKSDAILFQKLCRFGWIIGKFQPLIFDFEHEIYEANGINFNSISHLESLGLVQFSGIGGYSRRKLPKQITVAYCGVPLDLTFPNDKDNQLSVGNVLLTRAGLDLATVCESPGIPEFRSVVEKEWEKFLPDTTPKEEPKPTEQDVGGNGG